MKATVRDDRAWIRTVSRERHLRPPAPPVLRAPSVFDGRPSMMFPTA